MERQDEFERNAANGEQASAAFQEELSKSFCYCPEHLSGSAGFQQKTESLLPSARGTGSSGSVDMIPQNPVPSLSNSQRTESLRNGVQDIEIPEIPEFRIKGGGHGGAGGGSYGNKHGAIGGSESDCANGSRGGSARNGGPGSRDYIFINGKKAYLHAFPNDGVPIDGNGTVK